MKSHVIADGFWRSGRNRPLLMFVAIAIGAGLTGCDKPAQQPAASAPPPVTVAQPTKRTVTDWDEFTGRFEAIQQVQVRARVTGFVTGIEFKDGAFVKTGDLLYVIDSRQYEALAEQARGQLLDAKAKAELAERELARAAADQDAGCGRVHRRSTAPAT